MAPSASSAACCPSYEEKVAELAADKVDVIHPAGTPPFMLLGYRKEQELIAAWEKKYGVPIFTSGSNQVRALKALGVKKFVGIGYDFDDTSIVKRYFTDAGFKVLGLERLPVKWEDVGQLSSHEIYRLTKQVFLNNPGADAIYVQGGKMRMLDIVELLEQRPAVCRCCIPASPPPGRSCCGCMCASRRRATAACLRSCRRAEAGPHGQACPGTPAFFARSTSYGQPGHDGLCPLTQADRSCTWRASSRRRAPPAPSARCARDRRRRDCRAISSPCRR